MQEIRQAVDRKRREAEALRQQQQQLDEDRELDLHLLRVHSTAEEPSHQLSVGEGGPVGGFSQWETSSQQGADSDEDFLRAVPGT